MENDNHELDKRFRDKLDANRPELDDALWGQIERELDKTKRRAAFWRRRYLALLLLLLAGLTGVYTVYTLQRDDVVTTTHNPNRDRTSDSGDVTTQSHVNTSHQGVSQKTNSNPSLHASEPLRDNASSATSTVATSAAPNTHQTQLHGDANSNAANNNKTTTGFASDQPTASNVNNGLTNSTKQTTTAQQPTNSIAAVDSTLPNAQSSNANKNDNAETNDAKSIVEQRDASLNKDENVEPKTSTAAASNDALNHRNDSIVAESVGSNDSTVASNPSTVEGVVRLKSDSVFQAPTRALPFHVFAGVYAQLNTVTKTIDAAGNVRPEYLERRRGEEKKANALSYGFKIGIELARFSVQSGVGMRGYADNLIYEKRQLCYDIQNKGTLAAPLYDTVKVHTGSSSMIGMANGKAINRYAEIPLAIGYRVGNASFFVRPVIGVAAALPLSWKSKYLNTSVSNLESPKDAGILRPAVFNALAELTASAALSERFYVDFGMNYDRNLSSVFKKSSGLTQRYASWGGTLGATYRF